MSTVDFLYKQFVSDFQTHFGCRSQWRSRVEDTWHSGDCFLKATKSQYNELLSAEMHIAKC